jgi:hypothetical protein
MTVVKKINLNAVEEFVKNMIKASLNIKLLQDELEDVILQLKDNEKYLSRGDISLDVYKENKSMLEKNKKEILSKINEAIRDALSIAKNGKALIEMNRI